MARDALLLVDAQRDYFARPGLMPAADIAIAAMARLLSAVRARGWLVAHSHTLVVADGADAMPHWRASGRIWCRAGTPGALPPKELAPRDGEPVFAKRFYSPFEDPALPRMLAGQRAKRLGPPTGEAHAATPARNLGIASVTRVPLSGVLSNCRPYSGP